MPWHPACCACVSGVPCPRFWTAADLSAHAGSAAFEGDGAPRAGGEAAGTAMARPAVMPTNVRATAPEAFMVLHLRMRVVEEQTTALVRDLEALSIDGQSLDHFHSKTSETPASHPAISPVQARVAFVGENTLWKNCETLVNQMCQLVSVVQTLKLNIFRLQLEKELNPKHAAQLEQRLNATLKEHLQEMKIVQQEATKLPQHLSDMKEAEEKAQEVQRLSIALEIITASKMDVMVAAEELRNIKQKINCRLQELTEQLSQESSLWESSEESQATVMCHIRDMETTVEAEWKKVKIQQNCQELRKDVQLARVKLQEEEERTAQLEQRCTQLKSERDSRNGIISQLGEEAKNAQLSFSKQCKENLQLHSKMTALETAQKVEVFNDHLSQQCSDLSTILQSLAMENAKFISDHQTMLKEEQEKACKLQEQDWLLNASNANTLGELQSMQHERALQRELEALRTEHGKYGQKASLAEEAATTQRKLLESTVARLQGELETALQEKGSLLAEKEDVQQEVSTTANETIQERNKLEVEKAENELEIISMKFTLTLEEENKRLLDCLATLVREQHAQQQMQQVLAELTDSKNKLTCDKGKLQMANLQHQRDTAKDANSKATAMLEHVLASHEKVQAALDVATELGHKDAEISNLRKDKSQNEQKIQRLETALEHCQAKLVAMGKHQSSQVEPLCRALIATTDNQKLDYHLEEVLQLNNALQSKLIQVQYELKRKETEHQRLMVGREELMEKAKTEEKMYAELLESLKKQFQTEQEASRKAACQESAELKKCLEKSSSELVEVSLATRELRQKETESKLRKMEAIREEYQKKNYEQSQAMQKVVSELKSVQNKMQMLLKNHHEVQMQNRQLDIQLEAERKQMQQMENECQKLEKITYLKKYKEEAEKKLREASMESEQITASLEAADRWFKSKFGCLPLEYVENCQPKNPEESSSKKGKASTLISEGEAKKIGEAARRASHSCLPRQQGKDPMPPAHRK
ncbi:LOW QUALITY PROTEIN: coiled-coil domain-containing protein 150 [Cariama cristata]